MHFKTALCLVITVIRHSAAAEYDSTSIESLVNNTVEKMEQNIIGKLHVQNKELVEMQAESIKNLVYIIQNLLAVQLEIPNQLHNATKDRKLHNGHVYHEKTCDNASHYGPLSIEVLINKTMAKLEKKVDSFEVQNKQVIEKLAAHTTPVQQMGESIKNLRNITDNLLEGQSYIGKQLMGMNNKYYQLREGPFPSSCATLNINATMHTYYIRPDGADEPFLVRCDFEKNYNLGGGWTVFQHRYNGTVDFYQNWTMYKNGFGDVNGEHWLGLEKLHAMTILRRYELLVLLEDHEGNSAYALYDRFRIGSEEDKYKLTVGNYSGTAADALGYHNGKKFSTFDQNNDIHATVFCAKIHSGAWWFHNCYHSHLNGKYFGKGEHLTQQVRTGVIWGYWKGWNYSLKSTKMMLRLRTG